MAASGLQVRHSSEVSGFISCGGATLPSLAKKTSNMMTRKLRTFVLLVLPPLGVGTLARYALGANASSATCMGALSFFAFCDGWYFLRLVWWSLCEAVHNALYSGEKRAHLFATSKLLGRVLIVDVDRNAHCNNARFLRECGFARRGLWHQNGIWRLLKLNGGNLVVGAQTVRFRREMTLGQRYTIESRVLCWDNRAFYVEHRFVTLSDSNELFINAIVLVKNTVLGKLSPAKLVEKLPALASTEETSPAMPEDVLKWIESNDISSKALRK